MKNTICYYKETVTNRVIESEQYRGTVHEGKGWQLEQEKVKYSEAEWGQYRASKGNRNESWVFQKEITNYF